MTRRRHFNQKRKIADPRPPQEAMAGLASEVRYSGRPYHKRRPGDFRLVPPAQPRPDKTLCDEAGIRVKADAEYWLLQGVRRGLVSPDWEDDFPKHIWAVTGDGIVLEANLGTEAPGAYHGYPLPDADPFRQFVLARWHLP